VLDFDRYFLEFEAETSRLAGLAHDLDARQPIPTCPGWTLGEASAGGRAQVTVRQPALHLLLLLNRRLPVGAADVDITGRRELLEHWLSNSRF